MIEFYFKLKVIGIIISAVLLTGIFIFYMGFLFVDWKRRRERDKEILNVKLKVINKEGQVCKM